MIVNIFRNSSPLALIIIPAFMAAAWISASLGTPALYEVRQPMPLFQVVADVAHNLPGWIVAVIGFLLTTYQVFQVNRLIEKHEVLYKNSYLPGMAYMLLIAYFPGFLTFHPILIVNTILLVALDKMFKLYKNPSPTGLLFDTFMLVSVASLFYLPAAALMLLFFIGLFMLRTVGWRDLLTACIGLVVPYFLVFVYLYWTHGLDRYLEPLTGRNAASFIDVSWMTRYDYRINLSFLLLFFILTVVRIRSNFYKNVTRARAYQEVIFIYLGVSLATLGIAGSDALYRFSILTVPLAMMFGYYFLATKKFWWSELLFWMMAVLLVSNHIVGVY